MDILCVLDHIKYQPVSWKTTHKNHSAAIWFTTLVAQNKLLFLILYLEEEYPFFKNCYYLDRDDRLRLLCEHDPAIEEGWDDVMD